MLDRKLPDTSFFQINPDNGQLSNRILFDAETQKRYSIKVIINFKFLI